MKYTSIRLTLSIAASKETAFHYGVLEEELYMSQPVGFDDGKICKLNKSLYSVWSYFICIFSRAIPLCLPQLEMLSAIALLFSQLNWLRSLALYALSKDASINETAWAAINQFKIVNREDHMRLII